MYVKIARKKLKKRQKKASSCPPILAPSIGKRTKKRRTHHHSHQFLARLADAELELLDDVRDFFEAVHVGVFFFGHVGDHQERCSLE